MEYTSGKGRGTTVPGEIDKWNWGAFLLNWVWGVGNGTYIALLMFVPFVNIVMMFILGAKGSAWAWRNRKWESIEDFKKTQQQWTMWGIVINGFFIALGAAAFFHIVAVVQNNEVYKLAVQQMLANEEAASILGQPIEAGISWDLEESLPNDVVSFSFDVEGANGEGTIWVAAQKEYSGWKIISMVLQQESEDCSAPDEYRLINELGNDDSAQDET